MRRTGRTVWALALALLLVGIAAQSDRAHAVSQASQSAAARARALASAVQMQADAGFGGNYRPGAWVPIRVRISNRGPQFSGVVRVDDSGQQASQGSAPTDHVTYTRSVLMPQGGVKQITLYVPGADLGSSVTIQLAGAGTPVQQTIPINAVNLGTIFAGALTRNATLWNQLRATSLIDASVLPVKLDAATLDSNPLALASFDLIVIGDFNTAELSGSQAAALEAWVRAGGTLVEIGGPTAQATVNSLPPALQIVQPGQPLTLSRLPGLSAAGGSTLPVDRYVAAVGRIRGGTVVLDQQQLRTATGTADPRAVPLIVSAPLGMGTVVYSAIDPTVGPLASWSGLDSLWRLLAGQARSGAVTSTTTMAGTQQNASQGGSLADEIDNLAAPSFTLFIILLAIYVLLLVPLNFFILHRLRRSDWSWVTLPVLVVILVGAVFGAAYVNRGQNVRASIISMVYLTSGSDQVVAQHYVGVFAPVAGDYTVATDDARQLGTALFSTAQGGTLGGGSGNGATAVQTTQDTGQVLLPKINMWSSRNAAFDGITTFRGGLRGTLQIGPNGHITGTLTNATGHKLYSVVLASLGVYQLVGDLAAGQSYRVDWPSGLGAVGSTPTQQSVSDFLGGTAQVVTGHAANQTIAQAMRGMPVAALHGGLLAELALRRMAAGDTLPTNPDETQAERIQRIIQQTLVDSSPESFGQLVAIGWSAQPVLNFSVNGSRVNRQDTDLLVQNIPLTLPDGPFAINPGTIPVRLAGSTSDLQQGGFAGGGGFTISSQSDAVFVGQLPPPAHGGHTLRITSLKLDVYPGNEVGGTISADTVALYDWQHGRWVGVDASNGEVAPPDPARFVNAAGVVRVRVSAGDSSIGLADQNEGIALGATGEVQ